MNIILELCTDVLLVSVCVCLFCRKLAKMEAEAAREAAIAEQQREAEAMHAIEGINGEVGTERPLVAAAADAAGGQ